MFLDILNRYFKWFYMPKNTFFEGTKIFLDFVHVQRWLVQKNTDCKNKLIVLKSFLLKNANFGIL